jgi:hypothetical protein
MGESSPNLVTLLKILLRNPLFKNILSLFESGFFAQSPESGLSQKVFHPVIF